MWGLSVFWAGGAPNIFQQDPNDHSLFYEYSHVAGSVARTACVI
jgi:hypothetical protein